jgi:hypothetical protein
MLKWRKAPFSYVVPRRGADNDLMMSQRTVASRLGLSKLTDHSAGTALSGGEGT